MITQVGAPQILTTAFNPVKFYYDSTNKNQLGFRYLAEIYSGSTKLFNEDNFAAPRFGDGYGVFNIGAILQGEVPGTLNFSNTTAIHAVDSYCNYTLKIGESFQSTGWTYSDYEFYGSGGSIYNAYVQLRNFNTAVTHTYVVGDQINIVQSDGGATKPLLNGLQTIVDVPSSNIIVINIPFWTIGSGPTISGTTSYADRKKINFRNLYTSSQYTVINGAKPHREFPSWDSTDNYVTGTTSQFLTSAPDNLMILDDSSIWLNAYAPAMNNIKTIEYRNSNGDTLQRSISAITNSLTGSGVVQIAAGAQATPNIVVSGSLPLIKSDTEWYSVRLRSASGYISETRTFYIDRRCRINDYEILFRDRMGSYLTFAATLRATINNDIARKSYKQYLGDLSGGKWTYTNKDRGEKVYSVDVSGTFDLNTPMMDEEQSLYFKEMISSGDVYLKLDGEYWPCVVTTNSTPDKTRQNNRLIKYEFSARLSNNDIVNI